MPTRAQQVCPTPGCPTLTPGGPCPTCRSTSGQHRTRRSDHTQTNAWRKVSLRYRASHPTCGGCPHPTEVVDHRIPRRILVAAGIHNPDHDQWLQPLCATAHNRKTATIDKPLLARLDQGHDPVELAREADELTATGPLGYHP